MKVITAKAEIALEIFKTVWNKDLFSPVINNHISSQTILKYLPPF